MNAFRAVAVSAFAALAAAACAQTTRPGAPTAATAPASRPATRSAATTSAPASLPAAKPLSAKDVQNKASALESYNKVVAAYMKGDWAALTDELKASGKYTDYMTPAQRADVSYVRTTFPEHRPNWWGETRKTSNVSFGAKIWNKEFTANYSPSESLGYEMPVDVGKDGKMIVVVSWKPSLLDNPKPLEGTLAKKFDLTRGDLGEAIAWHELGHNYITLSLSANVVIELYNNHALLYHHMQEFYADMTALYHASPKARLTTLMMRIDEIEEDSEDEGHARSAMGIASLLMANILPDPTKWPSVHLPPAVPDKDVERKTAIYIYEHLDPNWTLAEDKAMREIVHKFIFEKGDAVFRGRGELQLPNNLTYKLMAADDRDLLKKRDAWVAAQLKKAIDSGRADKPASGPTTRTFRTSRILMPY